VINLASDVPGLARVIDPNLVNPWGLSFSPTGPIWFANNGSGVSDVLDGSGQIVPLVVSIPSAARSGSTPTGTVFNGGPGFVISENGNSAPSRFLFASEDGTISGWSEVVDDTHALVAVDNSSTRSVYTGLTLCVGRTGTESLYAADFGLGTIDVFDQDFKQIIHPYAFQDPTLPVHFAPFNIQNINNLLYVTYAQRDTDGRTDIAGTGHGFIDVYDTDGKLVRRLVSQGALNSPWGLTVAPSSFGTFGGALIVGNSGDGRISAFNPLSGEYLGDLNDDDGVTIAISNLWSLTFGNGHDGGDADSLFFAAGIDNGDHGLFGAIRAPQKEGTDTSGLGTFSPDAPGESDDYPLPPSEGPALRADSTDQPIPTADLLPLRRSSLALVPTLSAVLQPVRNNEGTASAIANEELLAHSPFLTPKPDSFSMVQTISDRSSQSTTSTHDASTALNALLNLDPSQNSPHERFGLKFGNTHLYSVDVRNLPSTIRDVSIGTFPIEPIVEALKTQPTQTTDSRPVLSMNKTYETGAGISSGSRVASTNETQTHDASNEPERTRGWANMMNPLFVFSLIWFYWSRIQVRPQHALGHLPLNFVKRDT
jgi:uncharacterized protein (TIGR03118 family)